MLLNLEGLGLGKTSINFPRRMLNATSITAMVLFAAIVFVLMSILGVDITSANNRAMMLSTTTINPEPSSSLLDDLEATVNKFLADNPSGILPSKAKVDAGEWKTVRMRVTGYCACSKCCGKFSDGITADGHRIRHGDVFVAADKKYKFGTELLIDGYNNNRPVQVKDRGRVIKGNRLDVFFNSHSRAKKWGVKYIDVKVKK